MTTVLLVEDDPDQLDEYETSLRKWGFAVISVSDGPDIGPVMSSAPIDIIVSDTNLPTLDGLDSHKFPPSDSSSEAGVRLQ